MSFMWGKQNDGQMVQNQQPAQPAHQPVPASVPAPAAPVPAPAAPVTNQPVAQQTYQPPAPSSSASSSPTVFGKSMKIVGEVSSDEELYLDGDLDGKLYLRNRLTIGPNSKVNADIKAHA